MFKEETNEFKSEKHQKNLLGTHLGTQKRKTHDWRGF